MLAHFPENTARALAFAAACALLVACSKGPRPPVHRERVASHDTDCREPARPHAFLYPSDNRVFGPDDPKTDGCALAVPDHLFCCPDAARPTDR